MTITHLISVCFVAAVLGIPVANAVTRDTRLAETTAATATVSSNGTDSTNTTASTAPTSGNTTRSMVTTDTATVSSNVTGSLNTTASTAPTSDNITRSMVTTAATVTSSGNITHSIVTTAATVTTSTAAPGPSNCSVVPCKNGGTCTNGSCICTANFIGWYCDIPSKCQTSDCVENNTVKCEIEIYKQPTSYSPNCTCKDNYEGERCQYRNDCKSLPCKHGGGCSLARNYTKPYRCNCKVGDASQDCLMNEADDCQTTPPINATSYRTCIDRIGSAQLICAPGFKGQGCMDAVNVSDYCTQYNCSDEQYCKPLCNVLECDGTDNCNFCRLAFEKLTNDTVECEALFADGYHDAKCLSEDMLFDGFDETLNNLKECSPYFNSVCTKSFGNGNCNPPCNHATCLWDGGDCSNVTSSPIPEPLPGGVVIQFKRPPVDGFHRNLSMISRSLLNATVIKNEAFLKVSSYNFTTIENVTRFLSGVIGKRPYLVDYVTDVFECPAGLWNTTNYCRSKCGHCVQKGDVCNWSTGLCLDGCLLGYHGDACDKKCPANCVGICEGNDIVRCTACQAGYHGQQCSMPCDKNCMNNKCSISNGECGCASGMTWNGTSCACQRGLFGEKCSKACDRCRDKDCDGSTGVCATGCVDGYFGTMCDKSCPAGCKVCDKAGVCSDQSEKGKIHGPGDSSDNTGVIIGIVVALLLVAIILVVACVCWRRRGQSGDYPIMDDDEGNVSQAKAVALVPTVVSGMQPPSPMFGRAHEMIDMDTTEGVVVYDGRASSVPVTDKRPPDEEEIDDQDPRLPADGDSEAEPEVHGNNGVKGARVTSSVTIEVDSRGRMLSITDAELVPSPSMLKHDEEVFTMEEENPTADKLSDESEVDGGEADTPQQSPLWDVKAPLASEENILSSLGPTLERTLSDDKGDKSSSSGSSHTSRKSSQSSKSSSSSSDNQQTTEM